MKIQNFRRLNKNDFPDFDESQNRLLDSLNSTLEDHSTALQGKLTYADNLNTDTKVLDLTHGVPAVLKLFRWKGPIVEVRVQWTAERSVAHLWWQPESTDQLRVCVTWDSTPTAPVRTRLLIIGG